MWKKTFIRSTLIILVALAGICVFATSHAKKPVTEDSIKCGKDCCSQKNNQRDFIIWESLSRAIVSNAQF
jgi:hypothetical protein